MPEGWGSLEPGQGDGSDLPGLHVDGPDALLKIFDAGSVDGPTGGEPILVDGFPAVVGSIEDGYGVRIDPGGDCPPIDMLVYGVSSAALLQLVQAFRIS